MAGLNEIRGGATITRSRRWLLVFVSLIVIAGAALRLHQLETKSLWSDELYTAAIALHRDAFGADQFQRFRRTHMNGIEDDDTFWTIKASDQSPPLFDLVAKGAAKAFDSIELSLRLPSAVFGIALLLYLAVLAWRAVSPSQRLVYILVLLMMAVSATAIQYSQEARPYSLGLLFSGILTADFYNRLQQGIASAPLPRWPQIIVFVLACHTHYNLIAFSALLLGFYGMVAVRRRDLGSVLRLSIVPLACLPWIGVAEHTVFYTAEGGVAWAAKMEFEEALLLSLSSTVSVVGGAFAVIAAISIGLWTARSVLPSALPSERRTAFTMFGLLALALANVFLVGVVAFKSGLFNPRYFVFALPQLHFAAAVAIAGLAGATRLALAGAVAVLLALTQADSIRAHYSAPKENYRDAAAWLQPAIGPGGIVFTTWNKSYYRVYLDRFGQDYKIMNFTQAHEAVALCAEARDAPRIAVFAHELHVPLVDALVAACGHQFRRERRLFHGIVAERWVR